MDLSGASGGALCSGRLHSQKAQKPAWFCNHAGFKVVPATGIELVTYALRVRCSTN